MIKPEDIAVIICTEGGQLECKSRLLVKSLRRYGGALKDVDIYSIQPRFGVPIDAKTESIFKENRVSHERIDLNRKYPDYGLANKVVACAHYEKELDYEYLFFLDSDQIVFNAMDQLLDLNEADLAIRVVALKVVGSDGKDENAAYWQHLYRLCGAEAPTHRITTAVDRECIFPYYNSGLVFSHRSSSLFTKWAKNFEKVMEAGLEPEHGQFFVEQSTLSATISAMNLQVEELEMPFNYPALRHQDLTKLGLQLDLEKIITWHYHRLLKPPRRVHREALFPEFEGEKLQWMTEEIVRCDVNPNPFYEAWEIELMKQRDVIATLLKKEQ